MIALLVVACTAVLPDDDAGDYTFLTVPELWDQAADVSEWVVVEDVLVTSPRSADAFYVQGRGGGPESGLRVILSNVLNNWPPAIGTPITLLGPVGMGEDGPFLTVNVHGDHIVALGDPEETVSTPWSEDPLLAQALVHVDGIRITSSVDPTGHADSDGPPLAGVFGVDPPGFNRVGDVAGIFTDGRVSLRDSVDWTGEFAGDPPAQATIAEVKDGAFPDGSPVEISGVVQLTPWSVGGQWAAVQGADGRGLWIDAEAWGVAGDRDAVATWVGEVRSDGDGYRLRVWQDPEIFGAGVAVEGGGDDGDLVRVVLSALAGPDAFGEWSADGWIVDNRFQSLDDLAANPAVLGVVRGAGTLAVIESGPQ